MEGHEKEVRQAVAEWLRKQAENIQHGCAELQKTGTTIFSLTSLPGHVS